MLRAEVVVPAVLSVIAFVGPKLGWPDDNWAALLFGGAVVWIVVALAWRLVRAAMRGLSHGRALEPLPAPTPAPTPDSTAATVGTIEGGIAINYGTAIIHNSPRPDTIYTIRERLDDTIIRPPDTRLNIVFEPQQSEPYSTHIREAGGLWHLYRFGVTANATTTLTVRLLQIQGVSAQQGHEPIRALATLFGPIPCDIRPTIGRTVGAGAEATLFDFIRKRFDGDQQIRVCRADSGEGSFGIGRTCCMRVEVAGAAAVEHAFFHVWAEGRELLCERVSADHVRDAHQIGVEDFSRAPILRWQDPRARIEKLPNGDYRLAVDVLCSNEGPQDAIARVQYRDASLVGWGQLGFEEFKRSSSIYPVLGDSARRFTLKIRQPSTGAFSHGPCRVTWSVVYTDGDMRAYLTTATLELYIEGVGPARLTHSALDETSAAQRYQRYLDAAPIHMRSWST